MDTVLRALAIYGVLMVVFRIAGKRTMAQITTFDFVLLLVIGESTQQALIGDDFSITTAAILIATLVGVDLTLSLVKEYRPAAERVIDGLPLILVADGRPLDEPMRKERINVDDVLDAARQHHGLTRLEQIRFAVLERDGHISIVPADRQEA